jgi:hypothetical protein
MLIRATILLAVLCLTITVSSPAPAQSHDPREEAAVGIALTAGNVIFVPMKAVAAVTGAISGAMSLLFWGGDPEVTVQTWQNTLPPPYLIDPELARAAVGERPELEKQ